MQIKFWELGVNKRKLQTAERNCMEYKIAMMVITSLFFLIGTVVLFWIWRDKW